MPRFWARSIGKGLGLLFMRMNDKRRRIASINLRMCFPEKNDQQRGELLRRHFIGYGQSVVDLGLFIWASNRRLSRLIEVSGIESFRQLINQHQRIILFTPHHLGMDCAGIYMSGLCYIVSMMKELENPVLNRAIWHARTRHGVNMVLRQHGIRSLLKALKSGSVIYYIPDEDFGHRHSVFVPFFGVQTATLDTLGRLCRLGNAVAVPVFAELKDDGGYRVYIDPHLKNFPGDDKRVDALKMNEALETGLRRIPAQYMWTLRWFKTRPEGESSPYGDLS